MRPAMSALFGLLSVSVITMAGTGSAAAFDYPYCLQGQDLGVPGECSYPSYEACMATASGRGLYCSINPRVAFEPPQPESTRRGRRYPSYNY